LPALLEQTRNWRKRDDFALFTVSLDRPETIDGARKLLRQHHVDYPVLWFGPMDEAWGTCDWSIPAVPTAFLIDPQGNIVLDLWADEHLSELLSYIIDERGPQPPLRLDMTCVSNADGSFSFTVQATNPTHEPLDVMIDVGRNVLEYWDTIDGKFQKVDNPQPGVEMNMSDVYTLNEYSGPRTLECDEFGCASYSFTIPRIEPCWMLCYHVQALLPGAEALYAGQGLPLMAGGCIPLEEDDAGG
jgi:hypothetical protein